MSIRSLGVRNIRATRVVAVPFVSHSLREVIRVRTEKRIYFSDIISTFNKRTAYAFPLFSLIKNLKL